MRSAGQELVKSKREDGVTAYRFATETVETPKPRRAGRTKVTEEARAAV